MNVTHLDKLVDSFTHKIVNLVKDTQDYISIIYFLFP